MAENGLKPSAIICIEMREVTYEEYREFFKTHKQVVIDGTPVKLQDWGELKLFQPEEFAPEKASFGIESSVWTNMACGQGKQGRVKYDREKEGPCY